MMGRAGACPECGEKHDPRMPHKWWKPYFQQKYKAKHGLLPTMNDAMAHCTARVKKVFIEELEKVGVKVK